MPERPYNRSDYNRALISNALLAPFNVLLLAAIVIAGILLGHLLPVLAVGGVAYLAAAARTYFDEGEAQKVLERERSGRRRLVEKSRLDPRSLAPPIAQLVVSAHEREARIRDAIARAELPYAEVSDEVDRFIAVIDGTAQRAQLLWEALAESPPPAIERRLAEVSGDASKRELAEALQRQLAVARRMDVQLQRFLTEMERVLVELDTVRGNLVSVSASNEAANQQRLADDVRALGDEVGALAEGMSEAYEAA